MCYLYCDVGMVTSAFEGIGIVLPIHDAMATPSKFPMLLSLNILLMCTSYTAFACAGIFGPVC